MRAGLAALLVLALAAGNCGGTPERASSLLPPERVTEIEAEADARMDGLWGEEVLTHLLSMDPADRQAVDAAAERGFGPIVFTGAGQQAREAAAFAALLAEAGWLAPAERVTEAGPRPIWLLTARGDIALPRLLARSGTPFRG